MYLVEQNDFYLTVLKKQIATSSYDLLMIWVFSDCEIQLTAIWKWVSSFWSPCQPKIPKPIKLLYVCRESSNWWGGMLGNSRKGKKRRTFWGKNRQGKPEALWSTPFPDIKNSIYVKIQNPTLTAKWKKGKCKYPIEFIIGVVFVVSEHIIWVQFHSQKTKRIGKESEKDTEKGEREMGFWYVYGYMGEFASAYSRRLLGIPRLI